MEFCCYVGVVSPTTPVRTACVLPMCKAGSYFRLRSLLLSVCSFVLAPDRTEPPLLWECLPDLFASRLSISNFVCRYVKYIYQPHLARRRDCGEQGRPSSARVAVVRVREIVARVLPEHAVFLSPAVLAVWVSVETSAAEGWVRPGVFFGESAAGEGRRACAFHREGLRLLTSLARGAPSRAYILTPRLRPS